MAHQYTAEEVADAIRQTNGLVSVAAQALGCSRKTVYNAINKYKTVAEALDDARERTLDLAEGKLYQEINNNNMTAIIFFLKTQGKSRGYVERLEVGIKLSPEAQAALTRLGVDQSQAVAEFEALILEEAAKLDRNA